MKVLIGPNVMGLEKGIPELQKAHPTIDFVHCADRGAVAAAIADADVYMGHLSREVFLAARKLQWVQSPSSGVNYFLAIPELKDGPVILTGARGTHAASVAESAMAMILAITRGIVDSVQAQPQHKWVGSVRQKLLELTDLKLGIIGLGAIGKALAKRAYAFDMHVTAVDMFPTNKPDYVHELWGLDRQDELLADSDIVVVTIPWTAEVQGMIGAEQIALMKPSAMLVGISRGGIIDQKALAAALREKRIASAALDVFEPEPLPADSELWDIENLLIAPHIAGGTQYEGKYLLEIFGENLAKFVVGEFPLRNQINKQLGF
ncbi:MAG: D-2-hydroxyacid dehydrogenase [Anaerolineae bacterium]|nr:D-2-hydroxyacid dehydrogenase [Anaerolineae bacterium]